MTASDFDYGSTTVPDGALFVAADEPLLVFPSAAAASACLEAADVANGVYPAAYGPHGETWRVRSEGRHVLFERTGDGDRPEALKALLLRYLQALGRPADETRPVADLVAEVWTVESDFWQTHDPYGDRFASPFPWWGCLTWLSVPAAILYLIFR